MGVLLTHISEYHISKHVELTMLMLSVNQKIYIKKDLENSVVCHFSILENAHF